MAPWGHRCDGGRGRHPLCVRHFRLGALPCPRPYGCWSLFSIRRSALHGTHVVPGLQVCLHERPHPDGREPRRRDRVSGYCGRWICSSGSDFSIREHGNRGLDHSLPGQSCAPYRRTAQNTYCTDNRQTIAPCAVLHSGLGGIAFLHRHFRHTPGACRFLECPSATGAWTRFQYAGNPQLDACDRNSHRRHPCRMGFGKDQRTGKRHSNCCLLLNHPGGGAGCGKPTRGMGRNGTALLHRLCIGRRNPRIPGCRFCADTAHPWDRDRHDQYRRLHRRCCHEPIRRGAGSFPRMYCVPFTHNRQCLDLPTQRSSPNITWHSSRSSCSPRYRSSHHC